MTDLAALGVILVLVSAVRLRISDWPLTTPMLFVGFGIVLGPGGLSLLEMNLEDENLALVAELTLAMLLFADAARIDTGALRQAYGLPIRLLGIGLPLAVVMGTITTALLLTDLSWTEAALVAAILTPTDAALGQAVVSNPVVPLRVRQSLNVESGLNDGLIVPVVAILAALAVGNDLEGASTIATEAFQEVAVGVGLGAIVGLGLAFAIPRLNRFGWSDGEGLRLLTIGAALAAFGGAGLLGGNGFIAAFVCGVALRAGLGETAPEQTELAEDVGQIGASATFVIFGALMVWPALEVLTVPVAICALATLSLGRMIPVAVALIGTGLKFPTVAFLGWFGPRGLASMLFGLLIVTERGPEADNLFAIIAVVILASVFLHGASAAPLASSYGRWFAANGRHDSAERHSMPESPTRWRR